MDFIRTIFRRRPLLLALCALAFFALAVDGWPLKTDPSLTAKSARYEAFAAGISEIRDGRTRLTADLSRRLSPVPAAVSGRVLLTVDGACPVPEGARLEFQAAVKRPRAYKNPGVFDYRAFLRRQGIALTAFVPSCEALLADRTGVGLLSRLQERLIGRLQDGDLENGAALSTMLFGTRSLSRELSEKIRDLGLSHLFAISGMQFGVMAALVYGAVGFLTGFFPQLYLKWPRQKMAALATLVFIALYLAIALPQPSIMRAGLMIGIYFLAVLAGRRGDLAHALLFSAVLILAVQPLQIFHVSFQLSYLCLLTLILLAAPVAKRLENFPFWKKSPAPLRFFAAIAGTTWLLGIVLAPLIALDFGTLNFSGFIHNLWAIPFFDFILVPLSLAYFGTALLSPRLAEFPLKLWDDGVGIFLRLIEAIPEKSFLNFEVFPPHSHHVAILYGGIFLTAVTRRKRVALAAALLLAASFALTEYQLHRDFELRVTQIDVGQGDAILVQTPEKNLLIDAGGNARFDVGANVVKPFLANRWIRRLDAILVTHPDTDHYLGFPTLVDSFEIGEVWVPAVPEEEPAYRALLEKIRTMGIPIRAFSETDEIKWDKNLSLKFYPPPPDPAFKDNDRSLILRATTPHFSALFTGDLMRQGEKSLVRRFGGELNSDFLKVGHHGSKTSTTAEFLKAVTPKWAAIGVAEYSQYGHPHFSVIKTLERFGVKTYRTDLDGAITLTVEGKDVNLETFAER